MSVRNDVIRQINEFTEEELKMLSSIISRDFAVDVPKLSEDINQNPLADLYTVGHRFAIRFEVTTNQAVADVMSIFKDKAGLKGLKCLAIDVKDLSDVYGAKIEKITDFVNSLIDEGDMTPDGMADYVTSSTGYNPPEVN